jgi:hypothetical protein
MAGISPGALSGVLSADASSEAYLVGSPAVYPTKIILRQSVYENCH